MSKLQTTITNFGKFVNDLSIEKFKVVIVSETSTSSPMLFVFRGNMSMKKQDKKTLKLWDNLNPKDKKPLIKGLKKSKDSLEQDKIFSNTVRNSKDLEKILSRLSFVEEVSFK